MQFNKEPLTFQKQLDLLIDRGLTVDNRPQAVAQLKNINYYRLSAYRFPFVEEDDKDLFIEGATFTNLWNLYTFDRELRLHLLDGIERIEVAVRTRWANYLAITHGSHAYQQDELFSNRFEHEDLLNRLDEEIDRSNEEFIRSYQQTYTEPPRPSIWAICEILSLGSLSKFYNNLKKRSDRKRIADDFLLDEKVLSSFLRHLSVVRNFCAHHARIWNRKFPTEFTYPRNLQASFNTKEPKKIYNTLVMVLHLMKILCPDSQWKDKLMALMNKYQEVSPARMGFPAAWEKLPIWSGIKENRI